jgi:hypothetical protein
MKKNLFFVIILIFIFLPPVIGEDFNDTTGGIEDVLPYTNYFDEAFSGQKKITEEDYQKTLKEVKTKQNQKKKNKVFKGKDISQEDIGEYLDTTSEKNLILIVPLKLINNEGVEIPIGHYKIIGEKLKNKVYLYFYQSYTLIAKVRAIETKSDFNENELNFVKLILYNNQFVKIIYGSIDFNAYTFIKILTGNI